MQTPSSGNDSGRSDTAAPRGFRLNGWRLRAAQCLVVVVWLVVWQASYMGKLLPPSIAVSPGQVMAFIESAIADHTLVPNLVATMQAVVIAFFIASVLGIASGLALYFLPRLEAVLAPYIQALNSMPRIALGPLFLLYFGFGTSSKVALAVSVVFFILLISSRAGPLSADPDNLRLARALGCTGSQIFFKVLLPVSVPAIFAGLRLGLIYSLLGVITMELIAAREGLGALIVLYSNTFQMEGLYAILIVLALIASLLNVGMASAERHLLRWQPPAVK